MRREELRRRRKASRPGASAASWLLGKKGTPTNRTKLNPFADVVAFQVILVSLFAGIVASKILPNASGARGVRGAGHQIFLGLARSEWRDIHIYASLALAALVLIHLALHWRWIRCLPRLFARSEGTSTCSSCRTEDEDPPIPPPQS